MAGDTNSNIFLNIDTSQAMTQLRLLEKELTALNRSLIVGTKAAAAAQAKYAQSLLHNVNATGQWTASMTRMSTASEQFATNLDRQRLSLKEYFRYGAASTKTFGKMFSREFDTIDKLVDKRVKTLQQQYVQLGRDAQGAMNAMKFTPKSLNMQNLTTQLMVATQKQQILNKLIDDGSTKLLNFGKNTQWAGRQLMVGFTIPLMLFGAQAIKTFKEIETQTIRFKKVYGDIFTDQGATNAALKNIRALADEYTKYGLTVSETIKTAADAAAAGFSGKGLEQLVEQTNKLAVLGGVTQEKALETTIALKNAFQIDTGAMAGTIDFLNAVENQTVVALEDLTEAIPRVAPVIQQLGGDVKDLAYFMAAMQEGGISAAQGANALKSGLASLINPSNAASKAAAAVGINIKGIVEANQGNLRNTVTGFAKALQPLTDLERTRVIEKVFGKYQFARISALLNNLGREGTQAARVLQLTNASVEELAILSQREMKVQADSPMNKLAGSVERLKASIAPIGELFAKVFTPVIEFIAKMAEKFNNLPDGIKKAIGVITVVVGGLGPIFLMTFGLLANAVANSVKGVQVLRKGYQQLAAGSTDAALKTQYLSQEELENISISNALYSKHQQLSAAYALEANALTSLTSVYTKANASMGAFAASNPGMFMPRGGVLLPKKFAKGTASVPGPKGAGDVVPAMLSPGESVIPTKQTQKYAGFINQIIQDKVPGFITGTTGVAVTRAAATRAASTRGAVSSSLAPVVDISSGLRGISFATEGNRVKVSVGGKFFYIPAGKKDYVQSKLKENEEWLRSKGRTDTTEENLLHAIIRKNLGGQNVTSVAKLVAGNLPKFQAGRNRRVPQQVKSLRAKYQNSPIYKELVSTHKQEIEELKLLANTKDNPYGITQADLDSVKKVQAARAEKFEYTPAFSHRFTDRQVDELPGLTQYKRNAPSNVFEEQGFFNTFFQNISGTSLGGMHISKRAQAEAARRFILDIPASQRTSVQKAVHATLDRRLSSGYYEKFGSKTNQLSLLQDAGLSNEKIRSFKRFRPKDEELPGFAGGVVSLGMPIPFKVIAKNRAMAQQIDARVRSSRFRETPPTNFGVKLQEFSGHSFPIPGIGGVYRKPNGQVVVVKPVLDEKAALAEQRATIIARKAHGLEAPEQSIKTMIDPTDLTGKRKIIVLESPYNPAFASGGTKFSKEDYFKQLVASTLRGDKDLSPSNVFGGTVTDVGAAGVFAKASGQREFNFKMPSMQDQAMINLLGVKGGARKAFAENTSDIARSMTPAQYQDEVVKEINRVLPKLESTIASFDLTGVERVVYQRMIDRLKDGRDNVNWGKFQEVHSKVKAPLELAEGIVSVPGPKGAGDIQPAMLSPGEAVIPAKQSEKYMPLIRSMIADKVPGFAESNVTPWTGNPGSWRTDSVGDTVKETPAAVAKSPNRILKAIDKFAAKLVLAAPRVADLGKSAGDAADSTTKNAQTSSAMTKEELKNARQLKQMNNMGRNMGLGMAASMLPMAGMAQASTNPDGVLARNMSTLTGVSMLAMIAPMLNTPLKLLAGVAFGYAAILKMQSAQIKKAIVEGNKLAESFSMTSKKLEDFGAMTGTVSRTQVAEQQRLGRTTISGSASQAFGTNFLSSETGKKFKEDFDKLSKEYESTVAGQISTAQLASAVNQGVLSYLEAESIITKMARDLKDPTLEFQMQGQLMKILGPDGQDLTKDPLKVQLELILANQTAFDAVSQNFQKVAQDQLGMLSKGEFAGLAGGALAGGAVAANAYSKSLMAVAAQAQLAGNATTVAGAAMKGIPVGRIIAAGAAIGTIATRIFQTGKEAEALGAAAGTLQGVAAQNFAAVQQSADVLNYQINSQIANLSLEKDRTTNLQEIEAITSRITKLEESRTEGLKELAKQQQQVLDMYIDVIDNVRNPSAMQSIENTFANPLGGFLGFDTTEEKQLNKMMDAAILGMQESWNNSIGSKLLGDQLQGMNIEDVIRISLLVESKTVTPEQMLLLKDVVERNGKDINQVVKFTLEATDPETFARITTLLGRFENPVKQQGFQNLTDQLMGDPAKLRNVLTALEEYAKAPKDIVPDLGMEIDQSDIKRLAEFGKEIDAIKARFPNGEFDVKLLQKYQTELTGAGMPANATLDYVVKNVDYFMKLPKEKRFEAIFAFKMLQDADSVKADIEQTLRVGFMKKAAEKDPATLFVDSARAAASQQYEAWRKSAAGVKAYTAQLKALGLQWKGTGISDEDKEGGPLKDLDTKPTIDLSWANDLVQRLKLVKEGSLNALKPLESLQKFLGKNNEATKNPMLDDQLGKLKQLEQQATKTSLATNLIDLLKSLDPEQFALVYKYLFNTNGTLNDIGKIYNEAFKVDTIASYLQTQKETNKSLESQIQTFNKLTDAGYNTDQIIKILEDDTLALDLANGKAFSEAELKQFNDELAKTLDLNQDLAQQKLGFAINDLEKQVDAYNKLNAAGVKQEVILEILKDKSNVLAIANFPGDIAKQYGPLLAQTMKYLDSLTLIEKQTKTFEQATQEAIDLNLSSLDLQARILQNQFDIDNIGLKAEIKLAEGEVEKVNKEIEKKQKEIDAINLTLKYDKNIGQNLLDDLQEEINDAQRKIELDFDRPIAILQEKINDSQRKIELDFDKPIQSLQDRSTILSNDLTLIGKAAESINEKYDKQEQALTKISQLNSDIAAQEKSRISLADALSQGDISAAAQIAQDMRTSAADAASRASGDFIAASRESELENLRSASGMTRVQIEQEQFSIQQQTFALEQQSKIAREAILKIEDQIFALEQQSKIAKEAVIKLEDRVYNITEQREILLLKIRDIETNIDGIKATQLAKAQEDLDKLQATLEKNQEILDAKLSAIDKEKLAWDSVQIKLDAYKLALEQSKGELVGMLELIEQIAAAMAKIPTTTSARTSAFVSSGSTDSYVAPEDDAESIAAFEEFIEIVESLDAAQEAADAAAAFADSLSGFADNGGFGGYDAAYERKLAAIAAAKEAERLLALAQAAYDATLPQGDPTGFGGGPGGRFAMQYESSGGMIKPKYFNFGGYARGTDIVPAMLTPGEFVMSKYAVNSYGIDKMKAINSGSYEGEKVYNYNLSVNVKSDANPEDIARVVMTQIRQVDSQRIRTQRA
jgi:TP901 family phage tail tape measure protein